MKVSKKQIEDAIPGSRGIISLMAKKIGCNRCTIYVKLEKYPELNKLIEQETETGIDYAEMKLFKAIDLDNLTAIIFYLKTKGKHRGYIESYEQITPTEIKVDISDELREKLK